EARDQQSSKLISIWQTSVAELKRDLQELESHTAQVETKMEELGDAHSTTTNHIQHLTAQLAQCESEIMDLED
ncbi:Hypothetical predicted protein, partial [Pelobates cultripes]